MSQLEFKPSLASYNLAKIAVTEEIEGEQNNATLKQAWINLGNQLEIEGIPKDQISTVATKLIVEKKAEKLKLPKEELRVSGYFYRVFHEFGWTNPFYSHGLDATLGERENSSINTKKPNIRYIDFLKKTKNICDIAIKKLEESSDIEKTLDPKFAEILNHEWATILEIADDAFNEKTKIPTNTQNLILVEAATASSVTFAGRTFMQLKLDQYEKLGSFLTPKQILKFRNGTTAEALLLFKPDSRDTAIFQKYFGLQCESCSSWRVAELIDSEDKNNVKCLDCQKSFFGKTVSKCKVCQIPLYKEDLVHIIKTNCCENCNNENKLPEELINYADPDGKIRSSLIE